MKRKLLSLCLSASVVFAAACASRVKNVTNLPPGVTLKQAQDWDAAVADLHKVASLVSTSRQTLGELHDYGATSNDYYIEALRAIAHIDQLELAAESVLRQAPQHFAEGTKGQVKGYVQQIATELEHLNAAGTTGIKNADSLQKMNGLIGEVVAVVNLVLSLTQ